MSHQVSGEVWQRWYEKAQQEAISADISLEELTWLLEAKTNINLMDLKLKHWPAEVQLTESWEDFLAQWNRRTIDRVPMQYLLGFTYWRRFKLSVNPAVLIPRPETELIIDLAQASDVNPDGTWVDLGTGSGAIACGLAETFPRGLIYGVDISAEALEVAKLNRDQLGFHDRIRLKQGSWFEPIEDLAGNITGIVANPPYIPTHLKTELQPEVRNHEPALALFSQDNGLRDLELILNQAPRYLCSGGVLIMEMMTGQGQAVLEMLNQNKNYDRCKIINDLTGRERFVQAYCATID